MAAVFKSIGGASALPAHWAATPLSNEELLAGVVLYEVVVLDTVLVTLGNDSLEGDASDVTGRGMADTVTGGNG